MKKIIYLSALLASFCAFADRTATEGWVAQSITNAMTEVNAHTDAQGVLLQSAITTEQSNRITSDTIMSSQISNQTANISVQVALLNDSIANEASARQNAINTLNSSTTNAIKNLQLTVASLNTTVNGKADAPVDGSIVASQNWVENKGYATVSQLSSKQNTLVSGTNIKTVNGNSLLGSGNVEIATSGDVTAITNDIKNLKTSVANLTTTVNSKADAPTDGSVVASQSWVEGKSYATTTQLGNKQDTLVSGTNIKTINNTTLLGNGNIALATPTDVSSAVSGKQDTLVSGTNIKSINNTSLLGSGNISVATASDISTAVSAKQDTLVSGTNIKTINNATLLGNGNIALATPTDVSTAVSAKQDTLVSGTNIKTINGSSLLGSGNITIGGGSVTGDYLPLSGGSVSGTISVTNSSTTATKVDVAYDGVTSTGTTGAIKYGQKIYLTVGGKNYTLTLPNRTDTISTTTDITTEHTAMTNAVAVETANRIAADNNKQATLVSGTNIKSINNASILSSGNLSLATPTDVSTAVSDEATSRSNADTALGDRITAFEDKLIDEVDIQVVSNKYRTASWELATNSLTYTDHPVKLTVENDTTMSMTGDWPNAKPVYAYVIVDGDYTPAGNISLVGYGTWPTTNFQCAIWYVDTVGKYYVNIITVE